MARPSPADRLNRSTAIDQTFARAISRKNILDWGAAGAKFELSLVDLIRQAHAGVQAGRPPTKVVRKALSQLSQLLERSGLPGKVRECGGRRHEATICLPEAVNDTISFVLVSGAVNGRTGAIHFTRRRVLYASKHVLERLHQRLGTPDSLVVLREVHSCLVAAAEMYEAAQQAGALQWPLVTQNGLFVCAPNEFREATSLVTWMRLDQLGTRWRRVAADLRAASAENVQLLGDRDFYVEFLRLHAWLLRPHAPGLDLESLWWAARPRDQQDQVVRDFESSLSEQEAEPAKPNPDGAKATGVGANSMEPDDPPKATAVDPPHVVKARERYDGIVVQVRSTGTRIVALRNGFFGVLRQRDGTTSQPALEPMTDLPMGARVSVEVQRLVGDSYTSPNSIVLQLPDIAQAKWTAAQQMYPVGSIVSGLLVWRGGEGAVVSLADGTSAWLPDSECPRTRDGEPDHTSLIAGQRIELHVVGFAKKYRRLLLSSQPPEEPATEWTWIPLQFAVGALVDGYVVARESRQAVIGMPDGVTGWLPDRELTWSNRGQSLGETLTIGQKMRLRVVGHSMINRKLLLSLRQVEGHPLDRVDALELLGATHSAFVSKVLDYGVFVALPIGMDGLLHRSNMPEGWSPLKGDAVVVRVDSVDRVKRRVSLSYVDASA